MSGSSIQICPMFSISEAPGVLNLPMNDQDGGKVRKGTGFLQIPLELRFEIYRHLLHAEYVYKSAPIPQIKLDTAILGVCRQVRTEASKVLYDENQWIMITGKWLGKWLGGDYDGKHIQGCGLPIICPEAATHIQNVVLRVSMTLNREADRPGILETRAMAYWEEGLDELCRIFWQNSLRCEVDIVISLIDHRDKPHSVGDDKLLAPFTRVQGVRTVVIQGARSHAQAEALRKLME
ncbi:MAG: hypothetical protein FRX48_06798 [Lasallia pustulata]|uniref:Uncharacterized protein n=1 Tax=Lasallia pustulata TaxID=136370 RepID=A0A5M8PJT3_9LECA|nr:MAG: hypothetical protein FRX48_06798 [Lasallia pustulata]